jgi:ABC-type uncharacterized transport system fused permease/ATPase subunit
MKIEDKIKKERYFISLLILFALMCYSTGQIIISIKNLSDESYDFTDLIKKIDHSDLLVMICLFIIVFSLFVFVFYDMKKTHSIINRKI